MIIDDVGKIRGQKTQENEILGWGLSMPWHPKWMLQHWPPASWMLQHPNRMPWHPTVDRHACWHCFSPNFEKFPFNIGISF